MRCAVCLYARNEEREIAEWLAYQHVIGFDACIIYDNASDDKTEGVVRKAASQQAIHFVSWPNYDQKSQILAYEDCLRRFGSDFDWIAFLDCDEFLVIQR